MDMDLHHEESLGYSRVKVQSQTNTIQDSQEATKFGGDHHELPKYLGFVYGSRL